MSTPRYGTNFNLQQSHRRIRRRPQSGAALWWLTLSLYFTFVVCAIGPNMQINTASSTEPYLGYIKWCNAVRQHVQKNWWSLDAWFLLSAHVQRGTDRQTRVHRNTSHPTWGRRSNKNVSIPHPATTTMTVWPFKCYFSINTQWTQIQKATDSLIYSVKLAIDITLHYITI